MRKKNGTKIMAYLALFGIIVGVIGTGLLIIFDKPSSTEQTLTQEEYDKLLEQINSNSGVINSGSGIEISTGINVGTGENN